MTDDAASFTIRPLTSQADFARCLELQQLTWGPGFAEAVPPTIQWIAARTGGMIAGAFDEQGHMVGFVFGISGWRDGRPVHWSDMLAVVPELRGAGLGRRLKHYQFTTLREAGIHDVGWTFDPLESRNAYLNFRRLGIVAREYIPDCYGPPSSPLHRGLGTDRLVAEWKLDSPRVLERLNGIRPELDWESMPLVNPHQGEEPRLDIGDPAVRIRIPTDIQGLKVRDPEQAVRWRTATRDAFLTLFGRGYVAEDLVRESAEYSSYILTRPT